MSPEASFGDGLLIAFAGFGVAPWLILSGRSAVLTMGSMVWMMVANGRNAIHRH